MTEPMSPDLALAHHDGSPLYVATRLPRWATRSRSECAAAPTSVDPDDAGRGAHLPPVSSRR